MKFWVSLELNIGIVKCQLPVICDQLVATGAPAGLGFVKEILEGMHTDFKFWNLFISPYQVLIQVIKPN